MVSGVPGWLQEKAIGKIIDKFLLFKFFLKNKASYQKLQVDKLKQPKNKAVVKIASIVMEQ